MKPELTTSGNEFMKRVRQKLLVPFSGDSTALFAVFPELGTGHFSIQFVEEAVPFLLARQWNYYGGHVYPLGIHIYNLSAITIAEKRVSLTAEDVAAIRRIQLLDLEVEKSNSVMLDGVSYTLIVGKNTLQWKMIDRVSQELENALQKLSDLAGFDY